jgi:hypothetical protein
VVYEKEIQEEAVVQSQCKQASGYRRKVGIQGNDSALDFLSSGSGCTAIRGRNTVPVHGDDVLHHDERLTVTEHLADPDDFSFFAERCRRCY